MVSDTALHLEYSLHNPCPTGRTQHTFLRKLVLFWFGVISSSVQVPGSVLRCDLWWFSGRPYIVPGVQTRGLATIVSGKTSSSPPVLSSPHATHSVLSVGSTGSVALQWTQLSVGHSFPTPPTDY